MDDAEDEVPHPPPHTPLGLDYFSAEAPERRASRAANFALAIVVISLLPFACGVVNILVAVQSYSPAVTGSHRGGAALFLPAGILICAIGLVRLATLRHWTGVLAAVVVLAAQLAVITCVGAMWW